MNISEPKRGMPLPLSSSPRPEGKNGVKYRIWGNLEPSELYYAHNTLQQFFTLARRFAWFGKDLEPEFLYEFSYPFTRKEV